MCDAEEAVIDTFPVSDHESHTIFDCYDRFHFDLLERYLKLGKQHQPVKSGCTEFEILNPSALVNVTVCLCDWDGCNGAGVGELGGDDGGVLDSDFSEFSALANRKLVEFQRSLAKKNCARQLIVITVFL